MKNVPALEEIEQELARRALVHFTKYTKPDYELNWHNELLCKYLDKFANWEIPRLMVEMPPRHGKSELVSRRLPAYLLGVDPDEKIIACSYSADLASMMNRDVQRIIDTPQYRSVFPQTTLWGKNVRSIADGSYLRNSDLFEVVGHTGMYRSAGVGGGITGMGGRTIILDDPIKNQEEASSPTYKRKVWEWYTSTLYTRLEKNGRILLTMTRWDDDDIAGRLIELMNKGEGADQWVRLRLPAIREDMEDQRDPRALGAALWPGKYNLEKLNQIKAAVGPKVWASLYQQRPAPDEGGMFPQHGWKVVQAPPGKIVNQCRYWDRAATVKGGDYTVGALVGKTDEGQFVILDVVRLQGSPHDVQQAIRSTAYVDGYDVTIGIEQDPGQAGVFEADAYIKMLAGFHVVKVPVRDSKEVRARPYSAQVHGGNFYVIDAPWNRDFIYEHSVFPFGKHDDQVDAASGGFKLVSTQGGYSDIDLSFSKKSNSWRI